MCSTENKSRPRSATRISKQDQANLNEMVDEHMGDSKRSLQMYDESALIMTSK